jgi:hypothetical protein
LVQVGRQVGNDIAYRRQAQQAGDKQGDYSHSSIAPRLRPCSRAHCFAMS